MPDFECKRANCSFKTLHQICLSACRQHVLRMKYISMVIIFILYRKYQIVFTFFSSFWTFEFSSIMHFSTIDSNVNLSLFRFDGHQSKRKNKLLKFKIEMLLTRIDIKNLLEFVGFKAAIRIIQLNVPELNLIKIRRLQW